MNRDRLLIKSFEIKNCGGFSGTHKIEFSTDQEKNFTIVLGNSGRGKSTIFKLIYWCLYGTHYDLRDERTGSDEGLINLKLLQSLQTTENVTGTVKLILHDQNGELHQLERRITATQLEESSKKKFDIFNNSFVNAGLQTEVSAKITFKDKLGNIKLEKDQRQIGTMIDELLPKELSSFFLFDGEKLVNFRPEHRDEVSKLIQDGIEKISGLKILDSLIVHATKAHEGITKFISGKQVDSKALQTIFDRVTAEKNTLIEDHAEMEKQFEEKKGELESIIERISSSKEGVRINALVKTEEANQTKLRKDIKSNDKKIHRFLFEKLPELLMFDTLKKSETSFRILEDYDLIPPSITRDAIDKIFTTKKCVCGNKFEENDATWNILENIKKTIIDKDMTTGITQGRGLISQMIDRSKLNDVNNQYKELINNADKLSIEDDALTKTIKSYGKEITQIGNIEQINYTQLGQTRLDLNAKITDLNYKVKMLQIQIDEKEIDRTKAEQDLNLRLKHEGKYNAELNKISILKSVVKFANFRRKVIVDTLLSKTERVTGEYFKKSVPQAGEFADVHPKGIGPVKISSNYDITAQDGEGNVKELSKGQSHVLGLSYVSGCRSITNSDTFLFIDSPLHNISGDSRNDIAKILSEFLTNIQIVLFVTDTEYLSSDNEGAESVRKYINPENKVWKEWEIGATCSECDGVKLRKLDKKIDDVFVFVCDNCQKEFNKNTTTGPRIIEEFKRNV